MGLNLGGSNERASELAENTENNDGGNTEPGSN
jgi:hypothetical protein